MVTDSNWRLEAISKAAKNRKKSSFVLKNGENKVGKKKDSHIKIPSVLTSREHCSIFLDGDKITLKDTSRNGTYITYSRKTKHYTNSTTYKPLEQNDMISFGFNTAAVYDVNDKNAFIYRLVKEQIETIDIDDSDDDCSQPPSLVKDKIINIDSKVIDIDSDSDSNYSGDECLQNIEEMKEEESSSSSVQFEDELSDTDDYSDSIESSIESGDDNFVVTKTILKCTTPTETIALDDDEDDEVQVQNKDKAQSKASDKVPNGTVEKPSTSFETDVTSTIDDSLTSAEKQLENNQSLDKKSMKNDASSKEDDQKSEDNQTSNSMPDSSQKTKSDQKFDQTIENDEKPSFESNIHAEGSTSEDRDRQIRLEGIRCRLKEKQTKKIAMIKAQPLRKRRQTISEEEYNERKKYNKQWIREKLADIGEQDRVKREAAAENAGESNRTPNVPKVKICAVSRGEILATDMLALSNT